MFSIIRDRAADVKEFINILLKLTSMEIDLESRRFR